MRLLILTSLALSGFAANSLLTRAAVGQGALDAWTFMVIRLVTGAVMLSVLVQWQRLQQEAATAPNATAPVGHTARGSWPMAGWLAGYAVLFTLAYGSIGAGPGALLLFGSVQLTMFASALLRGERLSALHWMGVALAAAGFLVLTVPGATAPAPGGAAFMIGAGVCWGAYSLAGRRASAPLQVTADNFVKGAVLVGIAALLHAIDGTFTVTPRGLLLASVSGAFASGMAYAIWYAVLPHLPSWRAATVQLTVPVLTALAAVVILNEVITPRLLSAMALVVTGIWMTTRKPS